MQQWACVAVVDHDRSNRQGTAPPRAIPCRNLRVLCRLTCGERLYVRSPQRFAADSPISALELVDADPGHWPHVLAFDIDHGLRHFADELLLLHGGEYIFDYIDRNEWHVRFSRSCDRGPSATVGQRWHSQLRKACRFSGENLEKLPGESAGVYPTVIIYRFGAFE